MNKKIVLSFLVILFLASSCVFAAVATPAATVKLTKNTIISTADLQAAVDSYTAQGYSVSALQVLESLISTELLTQGAERAGYVLTDTEKDQLVAQSKANIESQAGQSFTDDEFSQIVSSQVGMTMDEFKEALAVQYSQQAYVANEKADMLTAEAVPGPTDKEIDTFFRKNASQFVNPEAVKIALVLIPKTGIAATDAANLKTLQDALAQIKSGKLTFEKAVTTYSQDSVSKAAGGEVGWLTIDNTDYQTLFGDEFYDEAFELDDGEIADKVVDSNIGYAIIKVLMHTQFKVLTLTDPISPTDSTTVSDYIYATLYNEKINDAFVQASAALVEDLRKEAKINILYKEEAN